MGEEGFFGIVAEEAVGRRARAVQVARLCGHLGVEGVAAQPFGGARIGVDEDEIGVHSRGQISAPGLETGGESRTLSVQADGLDRTQTTVRLERRGRLTGDVRPGHRRIDRSEGVGGLHGTVGTEDDMRTRLEQVRPGVCGQLRGLVDEVEQMQVGDAVAWLHGCEHPELGEPWQVQKIYFNQDLSAKKWITIHEKMLEAGLESPFADHLEDFKKRDNQRHNWLSTRIACSEFFSARDRALLSHATQIDPEGGFFSASRKAARTYWPTEEFELALDLTGREPLNRDLDFQETDLFAAVTFDDGRRVPDEGMLPDSPPADDLDIDSAVPTESDTRA